MNTTGHQPFNFVTASYLICVGNQRATRLSELRKGLEACSDASIFYHTFQSLGSHHFLREGFSNDFAQWTLAACNRAELAEGFAALDIREYLSLADLRHDLIALADQYCTAYPQEAEQTAFEPFHFCEAIEVTVPFEMQARSLADFRDVLERISHASFNYHFITSRLRLQLRTNDFSHWFSNALGLQRLASRAEQIDIYTNTIETARARLISLIDQELHA